MSQRKSPPTPLPRASLAGVAEQLRSVVAATVGDAASRLETLRAEQAEWRHRYQRLLAERNALLEELARRDLVREAQNEASAMAAEARREWRNSQLGESRLQEELTLSQARLQEAERQLAAERSRRQEAEAALREARDELEEIRALVDLLELQTLAERS